MDENNIIKEPVKKKKGHTAIIIVLILVYTIAVSGSSVLIYRSYFENRNIPAASENAEKSKISKSQGQGAGSENLKPLELNKKYTVGDLYEITFLKYQWTDEISPSDTSDKYNYYKDVKDSKFYVVSAKIKNISGQKIDFTANSLCTLIINGEYYTDGETAIETEKHNDFLEYIEPNQETTAIFFASVPDEIASKSSTSMNIKIINNQKALDSDSAKESDYAFFSNQLYAGF